MTTYRVLCSSKEQAEELYKKLNDCLCENYSLFGRRKTLTIRIFGFWGIVCESVRITFFTLSDISCLGKYAEERIIFSSEVEKYLELHRKKEDI